MPFQRAFTGPTLMVAMAWNSLSDIHVELLAARNAGLQHGGIVEHRPYGLAACGELNLAVHRHRHRCLSLFWRWYKASPGNEESLFAWVLGASGPAAAGRSRYPRHIAARGEFMPLIDADGCQIHVKVEGPEHAPVLMLSNSLGTTLHMWDPQVAPFTKHFRLVRFDRRGHGKSAVPQGSLFDGAARPRRARHHGRARHSKGELVRTVDGRHGRHVARRPCARAFRPDRSRPTPRAITPTRSSGTNASSRSARNGGLAPGSRPADRRWFTKEFREREPATVEQHAGGSRSNADGGLHRLRRGGARHGPPRHTFADQGTDAGHHRTPRSGDHAGSRPFVHSRIPRAALATIDAAHISNIEQPSAIH